MKKRLQYEIGNIFNDWEIIGHAKPYRHTGSTMCKCICKCGHKQTVMLSRLKNGDARRCSKCAAKLRAKEIITCACGCGKEFARGLSDARKYYSKQCKQSASNSRRDDAYIKKFNKVQYHNEYNREYYLCRKYKAYQNRIDGVCHSDGQCSRYMNCLDLAFKCDCLGYNKQVGGYVGNLYGQPLATVV